MKNVLFLPLALLLLSSLHAQTEQGALGLGIHNFNSIISPSALLVPTNSVGIGFGKLKNERDGMNTGESNYTSVGLNGSLHYFIIDNLSAGINLNFLTQSNKDEDDDESTLTLFLVGPEVRYYIPAGSNLKVYLRGNAGFGSFKTKYNGEEDDPTNMTQFAGGAGLAFFPNQHVSIDLGLGYGYSREKSESSFLGNDTEYVDTNSGLLLDLGFTLFFGGGVD